MMFCQPGSHFYDRPQTVPGDDEFPLASGPVRDGWERETNAEWAHLTPAGQVLRPQGWKAHISATLGNAEHILGVAQEYCLGHDVNFKFVRSPAILLRRNSKYGDRGSSGKFVTIYPSGDDELRDVLEDLGARLEGEEGPYILSDLRWRDGPLYVRYGGFVSRLAPDENGAIVPCVEDPDGRLVPDVRGPAFRPPPWAPLPSFLAEAVEARKQGTVRDFPFEVTSALHFSNGGGVYRGTDTRTGHDVLLKEARPHAGIDELGRDAVGRLEVEREILGRLDGIDAVPGLIDFRIGREHLFLVREFVEAKPLQRVVSARNPLLNRRDDPEARRAYAAWALAILDRIEQAMLELHERGIVYADLHPGNVLVTSGDEVRFVDFETSADIATHEGQTIGAPGFRAPPHYRGTEVDHYAMGCLRLSIFAPLTAMLPWDPAKAQDLARLVADEFPLPEGFVDQVMDELGPRAYDGHTAAAAPQRDAWAPPTAADWPTVRDRIVAGILASATPERDDRLYPGDIGQFLVPDGGLSLGYGAAGVIAAIVDAGADVPPEHLDWLARRARERDGAGPGLFDGLAGAAYALDRAGRPDEAASVLAAARAAADGADDTLLSGRPGIGLALAASARRSGRRDDLDAALAIADGLPREAGDDRVGVLRGRSGHALLFLALHRQTGDAALLDRAAEAVRQDLGRMGWPAAASPDNADWQLGLLHSGSGGTGLVLGQLLAALDDEQLAGARDAIRGVAGQRYAGQAGLWLGRAGLLLARRELGGPGRDHAVEHHLRALGWYALALGDTVMFFGDGLLRLSCDLATGSAGVLAVVERELGDARAPLPVHLLGAH